MDTGTLPPNEQGVAREKTRRRGAGFFSSLLSKLGLGGSSGLEGGVAGIEGGAAGLEGGAAGLEGGAAGLEGGAAGLGGGSDVLGSVVGASRNATFFGGLLATKAGVVALILAGSTVAAGIGIVGSQLGFFGGPGGEATDGTSLFGRSGRSDAAAGTQAPAASAPAATSIDYFKAANRGQLPDPAAPAAEEAQAPAAPAASPDVAKALPDNTNLPANVGGAAPAAAAGRKLLAAANPFGGGGGSSASSGGGGTGARLSGGGAEGVSAAHGGLGAIRGSGAPKTGAMPRSAFGRQGGLNKAMGQAIGARNDNLAALGSKTPTSSRAGLTYDGGATSPGIGGQGISGGGIGTGGVGDGNGSGFKPNPQNLLQNNIPPPPKTPDPTNATPYQWAIYAFIGAAALALILLMISSHYAQTAKAALATGPLGAAAAAAAFSTAKTLAMLATMLAAVATMMGVLIMTMYGQMMQGLMFTAIGGILTYSAAKAWMDDSAGEKAQHDVADKAAADSKAMQAKLGWSADSGNTLASNGDGTFKATLGNGQTPQQAFGNLPKGYSYTPGADGSSFTIKPPPANLVTVTPNPITTAPAANVTVPPVKP